jgi:hypothetical protein
MPKASAPAQKIRGILVSSLDEGDTFSPVQFSSFLYESRLPKLGGWCQAIVSCSIGTLYPCCLVKQCKGVWSLGLLPYHARVSE